MTSPQNRPSGDIHGDVHGDVRAVDAVMHIGDTHVTDRLLAAQKLSSDVYLLGDAPPTRNQVAAILHALADHTFITHLLSEQVAALGADRASLGEDWVQATGVGRFFQRMGDAAQEYPQD